MKRTLAGALLLFTGGLLVFAGGLLPWGHPRTHGTVLHEAFDILIDPGTGEDDRLPWRSVVYYSGQVVGLGYPFLAGSLLALGGILGSFPSPGRWLAAFSILLHALAYAALAGACLALAMPEEGAAAPGRSLQFLGGAAFLTLLLALEVAVGARRARAGRPRHLLLADAANLVPAALILILDLAVLLSVSLKGLAGTWPVIGYGLGSLGAALAILGFFLRARAPGAHT